MDYEIKYVRKVIKIFMKLQRDLKQYETKQSLINYTDKKRNLEDFPVSFVVMEHFNQRFQKQQ